MRVEIENRNGIVFPFFVDKKEKTYSIIEGVGTEEYYDVTGNIEYLRFFDFLTCPTELQDFESKITDKVGFVDWNNEKEPLAV